jgi:hypothetical protein
MQTTMYDHGFKASQLILIMVCFKAAKAGCLLIDSPFLCLVYSVSTTSITGFTGCKALL